MKRQIGNLAVDFEGRQVSRNGHTLDLNWRSREALFALIEAKGEIVERSVLTNRLWPGVNVEATSLTKVISDLRKTLTDADPGIEHIQTIARLGYRLAVPALEVTTEEAKPRTRVARRARAWATIGLLVMLAASVGGWLWWKHASRIAEADRLEMEGQRLRRLGDAASLHAAIESFRQATEIDPSSARHFVSLAEALNRVTTGGWLDREPVRQAAERAVQLDPNCAGCQAVLGFVLFSRFWDWAGAEKHLLLALKNSPKRGPHGYLAMWATSQGKLAEALQYIDQAIADEPYSATFYQIKAAILCCLRRYPEAVAVAKRALAINSDLKAAWDWNAHALALDGQAEQALTAYERFEWDKQGPELEALLHSRGWNAALARLLSITDGGNRERLSYRRAQWRMHLADYEGALDELEIAYRVRHFNLIYANVDPAFDAIRAHPRFHKILSDMNLPKNVVAGVYPGPKRWQDGRWNSRQ